MNSSSFIEIGTPQAAMKLTPGAAGGLQGGSLSMSGNHSALRTVVFGGQLIGQIIVAASAQTPGKRVASLHVVFARPGNTSLPLDFDVQTVRDGGMMATVKVDVTQGTTLICTAVVTLDAGEPDLITHSDPPIGVASLHDATPVDWSEAGSEVRMVGDVDFITTEVDGPPEATVWVRFDDVGDDVPRHQALVAWYTDMFLMGVSMRPHEGVGFDAAHASISTGVIAHTIVFHRAVRADEWFMISQRSTFAGAGRYYGTGAIHGRAGDLLASFSQLGMIRAWRQGASREGGSL